MCLILFAWKAHPQYRLIMVANRDEFYHRPTAQAHFWEETPHVLAGKDLQAGGTWLGMTKTGRLAAITNYRDPKNIRPDAASRGELTSKYLISAQAPEAYLGEIHQSAKHYNGYNLLVGDMERLWYTNNINKNITELNPGVYGLSNALLDTPWPKVAEGKAKLDAAIQQGYVSLLTLMNIMLDKSQAPNHLLPSTGVPIEWEKMLSSRYIEAPGYGTRITSVLTVSIAGVLSFVERTHPIEQNKGKEVCFEFEIEKWQ